MAEVTLVSTQWASAEMCRCNQLKVPHLRGSGGHDQIAVFGQPGDGEIRFNATLGVEPLRVDDAAGTHVHIVRADPI